MPVSHRLRKLPGDANNAANSKIDERIIARTQEIACNNNGFTDETLTPQCIVVNTKSGEWHLVTAAETGNRFTIGKVGEKYRNYVVKKYDMRWQTTDIRTIDFDTATTLMFDGYLLPSQVEFSRTWSSVSIATGVGTGFFWMWLSQEISIHGQLLYVAKPFVFASIAALVYILLQTLHFYSEFKRYPERVEWQEIFADASNFWIKLLFSASGWIIGNLITPESLSITERAFAVGAFDASFVAVIVTVLSKGIRSEEINWQEFIASFITVWGAGAIWQFCSALPWGGVVNAAINGVAIAVECATIYPLLKLILKKAVEHYRGGYILLA